MKAVQRVFYLALFTTFSLPSTAQLPVEKVVRLAQNQYEFYLQQYPDSALHPRSINNTGDIDRVNYKDWTSGFFPGNLWYLYCFTKKPFWEKYAADWTASLAPAQWITTTHDLGFILYTSFGNAYHITGNPSYKKILLQAAHSLSTRFNPKVGSIRSWDGGLWHYPVIVDNLMNLQLLFWATKTSGDSFFYHIAISHINNDLKYRFRPDGSTYHVLDFDPKTGKLLARKTAQGYSDSSCWSRGQAWAIYGLTMAYRYTKNRRYLYYARKAANYFITHTSNIPDHIPYWDFNDPAIPNAPRDASAAAIAASGMLELSHYAGQSKSSYYHAAIQILQSLCTPKFLAMEGTNHDFLLKHCTGDKPANSEIDVPLIYGDYYFLQALWRYAQYKQSNFFPGNY